MLWLVTRPISGDRVLMTPAEMVAFIEVPDHKDLPVRAEPVFDAETHQCSEDGIDIAQEHPLFPLVVS